MVTIATVSDLHGHLPPIPDCDLLLIAGDIVPLRVQNSPHLSALWLDTNFRGWLVDLAKQGIEVVGIAGNHDKIFQERSDLVPKDLLWTYLEDSQVIAKGLKLFGTPWQPYFGGWAFNLYEKELSKKWDEIPEGTDILLVHGPPHGYGDLTDDGQHVGSPSLTARIQDIKPQLVVCGHLHESFGVYALGETTVVNASLVNLEYKPVNQVHLFDIYPKAV